MTARKPTPASQPATPAKRETDSAAAGAPPAQDTAAPAPATAGKSAPARAAKRATPARKGPPVGRTRWQR